MPVPIVTYTPAKSDAQGVAFAGVPFNDPVDTAYPSSDPDRVDAKYFLNQVQCEILLLEQLAAMGGGAIQVRNASGGTLNNGPVRLSGYYGDDAVTGNPVFKIVAADAAANTFANALLLSSLANNTTGIVYIGGDFTPSPALDTSGGAQGDQVYLKSGGGMTLTAPAGADLCVQVIGQIKTVNATGVIAGFVRPPKRFGTSFLQLLSVLAAEIGSGAATNNQVLTADGSGNAAWVNGSAFHTVVAKTADYIIVAGDSGTRFTNAGAGGTITFTLPAAALGLYFSFTVVPAQHLKFQRAGADNIVDAGNTNYVSLDNNTQAATITVTCTSAGKWTVDSYYGTGWAFA